MRLFKSLRSSLLGLAVVALATSAGWLQAEEKADLTAHQVVQATTDRVMKIIVEAQVYYDKEPQRFYDEIEGVLSDVVDFNSFARGVMGPYASKQAYMALKTGAEKEAFKQRMVRFSSTFKDGLVQTYAKGLLAFNGNKIEVLPAASDVEGEGSVTVIQHIHGDAEKPYEVQYKMRQNSKGDWKLRNVTIEAINLGKVYQSQFSSAVRQYQGDIDKVIDNWSVEPGADSNAADDSDTEAEG
ncbi:phospholipid-binding protein MlaC [Oceanicoccus sp. KOV_DT_Chl]|uniref:MlaC/ttg2D family ABC transporter substrate-binding protein n=1 Tax=Oceanicoccus sp. KOV_DT_Chl TaxID=1904639 RepID=UPI000C79CF5F|nr:ABC transporter substrate-binding protein [Oceanicoccus sp. KOV_DT_Chl]